MARDTIIGLDVGTSNIKIAVAENRSPNEVHIIGVAQTPSAGLRRGYVIDQEAVSQAIRHAVKEAERICNTNIRHAYISIAGVKLEAIRAKGLVMVSRADSEITETDIRRAVAQAENSISRIANKAIIHRAPIAFRLDGEIVFGRPIGLKGEKLETDAIFVTCLDQHLSDLVKSAESARVAVDDVIASPLASSHAVLTKQQKEVGVILIDIGSETTSLAVFEEGSLISLEVLPIGSKHITNDIALGLQVSLEEAEELKLNYTYDNQKKKLTDIVEARLDDIFELIENHLKKIGRNELLPAGAILIGGGANLSNIENFAKSSLKLPAKIGFLATPVKIHDKQILNPKWAACLGLCVYGLNPEPEIGLPAKKSEGPIIRWLKSFLP